MMMQAVASVVLVACVAISAVRMWRSQSRHELVICADLMALPLVGLGIVTASMRDEPALAIGSIVAYSAVPFALARISRYLNQKPAETLENEPVEGAG